MQDHADHRERPSRWPRRTPDWMPGIFYPLVVACLLGVAGVLIGLREDVAVLKVRIQALEQTVAGKRQEYDRVPASTWSRGAP